MYGQSNKTWGQSITGFFGESFFQMDTVYVSWAYVEDVLMADFIFPQDGDGKPIYRMKSDITIKHDGTVFCCDPLVGHLPGASALVKAKDIGWGIRGDLFSMSGNKFETVRDLWFNTNWLIEKAQNAEKLQDFIQSVMDGMSAVCNNRWELSVIIDDDDSSLIKIICIYSIKY